MHKCIWQQEEIPIADYLSSFKDDLKNDFLKGFNSLKEALEEVSPSLNEERGDLSQKVKDYLVHTNKKPNLNSWKAQTFKYVHPDENIKFIDEDIKIKQRFPTAFKLIKEFDNDCAIVNYSGLAPHTIINRHTGVENRSGEFIRIHIPLIIPKGDVFLEVYGQEQKWDNLFGFNNQYPHSAYNNTDEYRLIFLIDIRRTRAGLTKGEPYNEEIEKNAKPFVRQN